MEIPQQLLEFSKLAYANHDLAHNLDHALRVYNNACNIIKDQKLVLSSNQLKIFPYVMIGHDFRDHKIIVKGLGLSKKRIEKFYRKYLNKKQVEEIFLIHDNCSWTRRNFVTGDIRHNVLFMVLQDADWLDALGDIGLIRCIEYTKTFPNVQTEDIPTLVSSHIEDKLLRIPNTLNFESSRDTARKMILPLLEYQKNHFLSKQKTSEGY